MLFIELKIKNLYHQVDQNVVCRNSQAKHYHFILATIWSYTILFISQKSYNHICLADMIKNFQHCLKPAIPYLHKIIQESTEKRKRVFIKSKGSLDIQPHVFDQQSIQCQDWIIHLQFCCVPYKHSWKKCQKKKIQAISCVVVVFKNNMRKIIS